MVDQTPIPVAVIGCGRMGLFHARTYAKMPGVKLAGVYDADAQRAATVAKECGCAAFGSLDEALAQVSAVTIATPTQFHAAVAEPCLTRRIACLIEKPLAGSVAEGQKIVDWSKQFGTPVQVGHIERFNPAFRSMQRLGIKPQFMEVVRISPLTFRSIDVGVVMDMMIHDIDIVLKLAGSPVSRCDAAGVSVIGGVEDICNARLTFANGCVANITASRLAMKTERKLRIFARDAYISIDYQQRSGIVVHRKGNQDAISAVAQRIRQGEIRDLSQVNYRDLVNIEQLPIEDRDPLRAELESFIDAVKTGRTPDVTAEEGLAAVATAAQIVAAIPPAQLLFSGTGVSPVAPTEPPA